MTRQRWGLLLSTLGVIALSANAWRRLATSDGDPVLIVLVSLLIVVLIVAGIVLAARRDSGRRRAAATARPGWSTQAVWSEAGLRDALLAQGWYIERLRPGGGTRLTLAWSGEGIELWRKADVLLGLSWPEIAAITPTTGLSGGAVRPAVAVSTTAGAQLVLVPTAKPDGGLLPASAAAVDALVHTLRAVRDVS
ncbi:hypothetical protein ACTHAM_001347 [Cellulomonas soli]|uniref:hypothetical protein n=1 Tax=Cellulomonas soli TaxID=931535 RepID=UPI003F86B7E9